MSFAQHARKTQQPSSPPSSYSQSSDPPLVSHSDNPQAKLASHALAIVADHQASSPVVNVWSVRKQQALAKSQPQSQIHFPPIQPSSSSASNTTPSLPRPSDRSTNGVYSNPKVDAADPFVVTPRSSASASTVRPPPPSLDDEGKVWPEVGKSVLNVSGHAPTQAKSNDEDGKSVNSPPRKAGKTKANWVPIPAIELQAAADALLPPSNQRSSRPRKDTQGDSKSSLHPRSEASKAPGQSSLSTSERSPSNGSARNRPDAPLTNGVPPPRGERESERSSAGPSRGHSRSASAHSQSQHGHQLGVDASSFGGGSGGRSGGSSGGNSRRNSPQPPFMMPPYMNTIPPRYWSQDGGGGSPIQPFPMFGFMPSGHFFPPPYGMPIYQDLPPSFSRQHSTFGHAPPPPLFRPRLDVMFGSISLSGRSSAKSSPIGPSPAFGTTSAAPSTSFAIGLDPGEAAPARKVRKGRSNTDTLAPGRITTANSIDGSERSPAVVIAERGVDGEVKVVDLTCAVGLDEIPSKAASLYEFGTTGTTPSPPSTREIPLTAPMPTHIVSPRSLQPRHDDDLQVKDYGFIVGHIGAKDGSQVPVVVPREKLHKLRERSSGKGSAGETGNKEGELDLEKLKMVMDRIEKEKEKEELRRGIGSGGGSSDKRGKSGRKNYSNNNSRGSPGPNYASSPYGGFAPTYPPPFRVTPPPPMQRLGTIGRSDSSDGSAYYAPAQPLTTYIPTGYSTYAPHPLTPLQMLHPGVLGASASAPASPSPPVPTPVTVLNYPLDRVRWLLLGQLEYYLSSQNLASDFYLRQQMDSRGWIPISLIASFNRVKQFTMDIKLVKEVLLLSSVVEVLGDWVRMKGWESFVLPTARVSAVEGPPRTNAPVEVEEELGARSDSPVAEEMYEEELDDGDDDDDEVEFVMGVQSGSWTSERPQV